MDTEEIFKAALAKFPVINIEAREEIRRIRKLYPDANEGNRLSRDLGFLMLELIHPPFEEGDSMARNDLDNRFSLTFREIVEYAKPYLKTDPLLIDAFEQGVEAKTIVNQISAFDLILQHARSAYANDEKSRQKRYEMLSKSISYCPDSHEVFYKGILASRPKPNSLERSVWKLLFECKTTPRRAFFSDLSKQKDTSGQFLFPNLGDMTTSDIRKWNKKFDGFGVSVHRKDGDSIVLEESPVNKK